jgi:hypothetical protein
VTDGAGRTLAEPPIGAGSLACRRCLSPVQICTFCTPNQVARRPEVPRSGLAADLITERAAVDQAVSVYQRMLAGSSSPRLDHGVARPGQPRPSRVAPAIRLSEAHQHVQTVINFGLRNGGYFLSSMLLFRLKSPNGICFALHWHRRVNVTALPGGRWMTHAFDHMADGRNNRAPNPGMWA